MPLKETSGPQDAPSSDKRFRDKVIVITGAGGNFGRCGCLYFALRGAKVAAMDKNAESLEETVACVAGELRKTEICTDVIQSFECDVTSVSKVEEAVAAAASAFGRIDLLWNNAGYQGQIKPTLEYSVEDFSAVMSINVTGMFTVLQAVAKRMVASDETRETGGTTVGSQTNSYKYAIVNTASVAGMRGTPAMVAYSSSKAAVLAMTVATAKDLAPHGIRVNAISPALIGPGFMWERQNVLHAQSGSPYFADDPEVVAKNKISGVPMKRLGSVDEVVKSVAFLLSNDSSYTTAFNMVVDGGLSGGLR
mmetsp:Transcript_44437/g.135448  ORF Transcript_44437/g.135448 Transcript_44437/m.135448 type:complete len:307 (-) Transcript_44437:101-1021(-)